MTEAKLSFWARWVLAFRILLDGAFAARAAGVGEALQLPAPKTASVPQKATFREAPTDAALQLLAILQREGRFIDFLEEDVGAFSDSDIGAAARVVHEGCRKAIREHVKLEPVRGESEESRITLPKGFSASEVRLSGNVVGEPPFTGVLKHRGWRASAVHLPQLAAGHDVMIVLPQLAAGHDVMIVAPAEVELP